VPSLLLQGHDASWTLPQRSPKVLGLGPKMF
jgi:hypothetical protein